MEILRKLREKSGLTLRQVEEITSISNAYLSQLETGKIKKPSAQVLYVLSKLYSVSIETLLIESGLVNPTDIKPVVMKPSVQDSIDDLYRRVKALEFSGMVFNQSSI